MNTLTLTDENGKTIYSVQVPSESQDVTKCDKPETNFLLGKKLGSFFDDPAQYSKLLWNYSEEEGWEKVLKLLGVE